MLLCLNTGQCLLVYIFTIEKQQVMCVRIPDINSSWATDWECEISPADFTSIEPFHGKKLALVPHCGI